MKHRLYTTLVWYAVIRGVWWGLTKKEIYTLARVDEILKSFYAEPIRIVLQQKAPLFDNIVCNTKGEDEQDQEVYSR